jgi:hypothetical protein
MPKRWYVENITAPDPHYYYIVGIPYFSKADAVAFMNYLSEIMNADGYHFEYRVICRSDM